MADELISQSAPVLREAVLLWKHIEGLAEEYQMQAEIGDIVIKEAARGS